MNLVRFQISQFGKTLKRRLRRKARFRSSLSSLDWFCERTVIDEKLCQITKVVDIYCWPKFLLDLRFPYLFRSFNRKPKSIEPNSLTAFIIETETAWSNGGVISSGWNWRGRAITCQDRQENRKKHDWEVMLWQHYFKGLRSRAFISI